MLDALLIFGRYVFDGFEQVINGFVLLPRHIQIANPHPVIDIGISAISIVIKFHVIGQGIGILFFGKEKLCIQKVLFQFSLIFFLCRYGRLQKKENSKKHGCFHLLGF